MNTPCFLGADPASSPMRGAAPLAAYPRRVPVGLSRQEDYQDAAALDAVHLAWAGSTDPGQPHYYRVQGPRLLVEYGNIQRHADHAHSVWRDPESDFGYAALAAHVTDHHLQAVLLPALPEPAGGTLHPPGGRLCRAA